MRIAMFFGSFDPFHYGHYSIVEECCKRFDKVMVIPAAQNPWKEDKPSDLSSRMDIIKCFVHSLGDKVVISDIESTIEPPCYTYKTINAIIGEYGAENDYFVVCGYDVAKDISKWSHFADEIFNKCSFCVVDRGGNVTSDEFSISCENGEKKAIVLHIDTYGLSSTYIRGKIKRNEDLSGILPQEALQIIKKRKLYV